MLKLIFPFMAGIVLGYLYPSHNQWVIIGGLAVLLADFDFTGDLTSSKAVALRPTADDLGRRIVSAIVQYWP